MRVGRYVVRLFLVASNVSPPVHPALCGEIEGHIALDGVQRPRFEALIRSGVSALPKPVAKQFGNVLPIRAIYPGDPLYGRTPTGWDLIREGWLDLSA